MIFDESFDDTTAYDPKPDPIGPVTEMTWSEQEQEIVVLVLLLADAAGDGEIDAREHILLGRQVDVVDETGTDGISDEMHAVWDAMNAALDCLEAEDRLGNHEIQRLVQIMNQNDALAANVAKKDDDRANAVIGKI